MRLRFAALWISMMTSLTACTNTVTHTISATDPTVSVMGRTVIHNEQHRIGYPGVTLHTRVNAKALFVEVSSSTGNNWIDVSINGETPVAYKIPKEKTSLRLFEHKKPAVTDVSIVHRTENWQGELRVDNFTASDGTFLRPAPLPTRKIMILGDSVTCGEAVDREAGKTKNPSWWNARDSYGYLIARALKAQVHLVCWGGRGLVRSWNGNTDEGNLPVFSEWALADKTPWNPLNYQPDLILSAIGTNDFSQDIPEPNTYITTYIDFLERLHIQYPGARIALTEGSILNGEKKDALTNYLQRVERALKTLPVHWVRSTHYPGDAQDAHPTKEQHARMADDLVPQLQSVMNW